MAVGEKIINKLQSQINTIINQSTLSRDNQISQICQIMRDQFNDIPDYDMHDFNDRMNDFLSGLDHGQFTLTVKALPGIRPLLETYFLECSIEQEDSEDETYSNNNAMSP